MSETLPVAVTGLTYDDEFNSFISSQDGSKGWMTSLPYGGEAAYTLAGNGEQEFYGSPSAGLNPFSLSNGVLSITATQANGSNPYGLPYNSGVITTYGDFAQTYGYFEVNAQLPAGQGLWPAFWLLPASGAYTSELDVFEQLGANAAQIYGTVHGSTNGSWSQNSQQFNVANTATGFHTYGVDWEPATTTFYMDGVELGSAPTPSSMNSPMFMLLNLAIGGGSSWGGAVSGSAIPATMQINYVRAYATAGTTYAGGAAAISNAAVPMPAPVTLARTVIGSGPQTLELTISEDAFHGNALFTVSINGVQQGGTLTASATNLTPYIPLSAQSQAFDIEGSFSGTTVVTVNFLNDLYGGSAAADRNLYLLGATIDGTAINGSALNEAGGGPQSFSFTNAAAPGATVVGSGADTLALQISEDAYLGNAQFTVSVDGVQQGGTLVATAVNAAPYKPTAAQSQIFDIDGSFAAGPHFVIVDFLNNAYGGTAATDRNLYLIGAAIDGAPIAGAVLNETGGGPQSFSFSEPIAPPSATASSGPTAAVIVGSGADTLTLQISEDAYIGNALFTVSINGIQQGGTLTATATNVTPYVTSAAQSQSFDIKGNFAAGANVVTIDFLNNLYGGTPTTDRNLFVLGAAINGVAVAGSTLNEESGGPQSFSFTTPMQAAAAAGPLQTLTLGLTETRLTGDAQYQVTVDGTDVGGVQTVRAATTPGQPSLVSFTGAWGNGAHSIGVSFLNPGSSGAGTTAEQLLVSSVSLDGVAASGPPAVLLTTAPQTFTTAAITADALGLSLSEDAYLGDAQVSISVDGTALGPVRSVTALHGTGATEAFNFSNVLSVGTHDLAISFLNDAYGGSTNLDRNLYVDSISVAGAAIGGGQAAMYSNGTTHVSLVVQSIQ